MSVISLAVPRYAVRDNVPDIVCINVNSLGIIEQPMAFPASETIMKFPYSRLTFVTSTRFGKRNGNFEQ